MLHSGLASDAVWNEPPNAAGGRAKETGGSGSGSNSGSSAGSGAEIVSTSVECPIRRRDRLCGGGADQFLTPLERQPRVSGGVASRRKSRRFEPPRGVAGGARSHVTIDPAALAPRVPARLVAAVREKSAGRRKTARNVANYRSVFSQVTPEVAASAQVQEAACLRSQRRSRRFESAHLHPRSAHRVGQADAWSSSP